MEIKDEYLYSLKEINKSLGGVVVYSLKKNDREPFHTLIFTVLEVEKGDGKEGVLIVKGEFYKGLRKSNPYVKNYDGGLIGDLIGKKEISRIPKDKDVKRDALEITMENIVDDIRIEKTKAENSYKNIMDLRSGDGITGGVVDGLNVNEDVKKEVIKELQISFNKIFGEGEYEVNGNIPLYHFNEYN